MSLHHLQCSCEKQCVFTSLRGFRESEVQLSQTWSQELVPPLIRHSLICIWQEHFQKPRWLTLQPDEQLSCPGAAGQDLGPAPYLLQCSGLSSPLLLPFICHTAEHRHRIPAMNPNSFSDDHRGNIEGHASDSGQATGHSNSTVRDIC